MNPKPFKQISFHTFLLPVFFVWHIYNEYFGLFPFMYNARFIGYYLCLALALFFLGRMFFGSYLKAGCWATLLLIIFFFWGAFHDFLKTIHLPAFFTSYTFLLSCIVVFLILLTIYFRKKKSLPVKLNWFLNLLFFIFLLAEALVSSYKLIKREHLKNNLAYYSEYPAVEKLAGTTNPDIFFIIFDEYASFPSLKNYLHYDNSLQDSLLVRNNFFVAHNSKSNYNSTPHSIASSLDMDYFNIPMEGSGSSPKQLLIAQYTLKKSLIPRLLRDKNYNIINYGLCDLEGSGVAGTPLFNHNIPDALYNETLWARIQKEIGWHFNIPFLPNTRKKALLHFDEEVSTMQDNFKGTLRELQTQTTTPKFVFAHIFIPHDPYYFNSSGERRTVLLSDNNTYIRDSLYIDQLKYANKWMDSLIRAANQPFDRPRVVIIEGDHGRRDDPVTGISYIREKQFMNLNAYYFSDRNYDMLYETISPVNSFRVVLNKYFEAGLPLLKDSTILLH